MKVLALVEDCGVVLETLLCQIKLLCEMCWMIRLMASDLH